ncbi:MAG TPA: DUF190 domain-containing protein [Ignavibacteria bacterium]|nr:DUF190 domain-containing protein [Ignavibacteria bacterium]
MQIETLAVLLRIFIDENDKFNGKNLYQYLTEYLKENQYAGVTVLRGITGFGKTGKIWSSDLLELSSNLPIVIEIADSSEKIDQLKKVFDETKMIGSALVTEEKIKILKYSE